MYKQQTNKVVTHKNTHKHIFTKRKDNKHYLCKREHWINKKFISMLLTPLTVLYYKNM